MGTVIRFPEEKRAATLNNGPRHASASIIILPVIRIERHEEDRSDLLVATKIAGSRRRRRRASDLERDAS